MQTEFLYTDKFPDPLFVYKNIPLNSDSVLLESQKNGHISYIAFDPYMTFISKNRNVQIITKKETQKLICNPIDYLKKHFKNNKIPKNKKLPLFNNGAIGYFAYDCVRHFIELPNKAKDDLKLPDIYLIFPKIILAFNHDKKKIDLILKNNPNPILLNKIKKIITNKQSIQKFNEVHSCTKNSNQSYNKIPTSKKTKSKNQNTITSNFKKNEYLKIIKKCKDYVYAGDSYQIKISQRFQTTISQTPIQIYEKLKNINPSPYAAFINFKELQLVSCSPEHLVKVENKTVETRPIGGTYPTSNNSDEDKAIKEKFINDQKEKAEHTMLIDLERNDLGRVCEYGSVKVNELMTLERYSHLWHIVTNIQGKLQTNKNIFDTFKTMFPGGTITGCPKKRTMEIIDEIEPVRRGPYTGSIGFMNFSDEMDLNLIIRTIVIKNNTGYIQVGGGIVSDSNAEKEFDETLNKGQALFQAITK